MPGFIPIEESLGINTLPPTLDCSWEGCPNPPKNRKSSFRHLFSIPIPIQIAGNLPEIKPSPLKIPLDSGGRAISTPQTGAWAPQGDFFADVKSVF